MANFFSPTNYIKKQWQFIFKNANKPETLDQLKQMKLLEEEILTDIALQTI